MGKAYILSNSGEPFKDRLQAGGLLARELMKYKAEDTVVLGIPRGGVVIASEIAGRIGAKLDIVLSRKLGAPGNPELAIGAVSEDGRLFLHETIPPEEAEKNKYIKMEKEHQMREIARRISIYRKIRPKEALAGKTVIVTDDGLATGATMQAALWTARHEEPAKLIAAVPVAPEDTVSRIAEDADELIVLRVPPFFAAVGQFYSQFYQVEDDEVLEILKEKYERCQTKRRGL